MKFYLAPLEGITRYVYRNAVNDFFGEKIDKYYTPFFQPHTKRKPKTKEMQDVAIANNQGINLVPQILTNSAKDMLRFQADMAGLGYEEVNLNVGCPSGTVVSKKRGSGFLQDIEALDSFFEELFEQSKGNISVKTRLGVNAPEEFYEILDVFNKYPICELTIHPRIQKEFYKGRPHLDYIIYALKNSKNPICYSGDIWNVEDYNRLLTRINEECSSEESRRLEAVMLGRGMVANPALIRQLKGGEAICVQELLEFNDRLIADLITLMGPGKPVLYIMKELWFYMIRLFKDGERELKQIQKANDIDQLRSQIHSLTIKLEML